MKKHKPIIGIVLVIVSLAAPLVCVFLNLGIYIDNPDMTGMRRLMEYPQPTICGVLAIIVTEIGIEMMRG